MKVDGHYVTWSLFYVFCGGDDRHRLYSGQYVYGTLNRRNIFCPEDVGWSRRWQFCANKLFYLEGRARFYDCE